MLERLSTSNTIDVARAGATLAGAFSGVGLLFGRNADAPVTHACETSFEFTGQLDKVAIDVR
jgi:hypothetical protein